MKKLFLLALILVLALSLALACSATQDSAYNEGQWAEDSDRAPAVDRDDSEQAGGLPDDATDKPRQVIRNAALDMRAEDVTAAYDQILAIVQGYGGYELQRQQWTDDTIVSIDAQLRVPPQHLDDVIEKTNELGEVFNTRITTDDITEQYYDTKTRLETMEKALDQYYSYLDQAENIEEVLSVQSHINSLTQDIESLKGRLALWESQLSESLIELRLRQIDDPLQLRQDVDWSALSWADMTYLIESGLKSVINVLTGFLQWLVIILIAGSPLWIPLLIVLLIVIRRSKRRRKREPIQPATSQTPPPPQENKK